MKRVVEMPEDKYDLLMSDFNNKRLTVEEAVQYLKQEFGELYEEKKSCLDGTRKKDSTKNDMIGSIAKINNKNIESGISLLIYNDRGTTISEEMKIDQDIIKNQKTKIPTMIRLKESISSKEIVGIDVLVQTIDYTYKPLLINGIKIKKMFGKKVNEMLLLNHGFDEIEIEKTPKKNTTTVENFVSLYTDTEKILRRIALRCDCFLTQEDSDNFMNLLILLIKILRQYGDQYTKLCESRDDFQMKIERIYQSDIIKKGYSNFDNLCDDYETVFFKQINILAEADWYKFVDFYSKCQELCCVQTIPEIDIADLIRSGRVWIDKMINDKKCTKIVSEIIMQDLQQKYSRNKIKTDLTMLSIGNDDFPYYLAICGMNPGNIDVTNENIQLNKFIKNKMNFRNATCWDNIKQYHDIELIEEKYDLVVIDNVKVAQKEQIYRLDELLSMSINSIKKGGMLVVTCGEEIYLPKPKLKQILCQFAEIDKVVQMPNNKYYIIATKRIKDDNQEIERCWWIDASKNKYMIKSEKNGALRYVDYLLNPFGTENEIYGVSELVKKCLWKDIDERGDYLNEKFEDYVDQKTGIMRLDDLWLNSTAWIVKENANDVKITDKDIVAYEKMIFEQLDNIMCFFNNNDLGWD